MKAKNVLRGPRPRSAGSLCVGLLPDLLHIGERSPHRWERRSPPRGSLDRFQGPSHIFRRDLRIQPGLLIKSRIQIDRFQFLHIDCVIHGLVAISCHKYGIASSGHSARALKIPTVLPLIRKWVSSPGRLWPPAPGPPSGCPWDGAGRQSPRSP